MRLCKWKRNFVWIALGKALGDSGSEIWLVMDVPALSHAVLVWAP